MGNISENKTKTHFCCGEPMEAAENNTAWECYSCGRIVLQKASSGYSYMMCCGQRMIFADDHGTASCQICGSVEEI